MTDIKIYTTDHCAYCTAAKSFFDSKGLAYIEVRVDQDPKLLEEMIQLSGRRTVPQILINQQAIGGFDDLKALSQAGKLEELL